MEVDEQQGDPTLLIRWSVMARRFGKLDLAISTSTLVIYLWLTRSLECSYGAAAENCTPPEAEVKYWSDTIINAVRNATLSPEGLEVISRNWNNASSSSLVGNVTGVGGILIAAIQPCAAALLTFSIGPCEMGEIPSSVSFYLQMARFFWFVSILTTGILLTAASLLGTGLALGIALGLALFRGVGLYIVCQFIGELGRLVAATARKRSSIVGGSETTKV